MPKIADIISAARELSSRKVPYRHGGRTIHGVDCVGVITYVCERIGYPFNDYPAGYSQRPDGQLLRVIADQGIMRPTMHTGPYLRVHPGDIGIFWLLPRSRLPQHVGIFTETGGLIHACRKVHRVVETTALDPYWAHRFIAAVSFKGVEA
jgi:cell wall-associated NlpC family hydrolase